MGTLPPCLRDPDKIMALQLQTDLWLIVFIPHTASFSTQALWRGTPASWLPEEGLEDYVAPRVTIIFDIT